MRVFLRERDESSKGLEKSLSEHHMTNGYAFRPHNCCLGCVSIHHAAFFVGIAELFVIAFSVLFLSKLIIDDGHIFYTTELEGRGGDIARIMIFFVSVTIAVIILLLVGLGQRQRFLLIPHILWQIVVLICFAYIVCTIWKKAKRIREHSSTDGIPLPSAIVLVTIFSSMALIHIWWTGIVIVAAIQMQKSGVKLTEIRGKEFSE
uniref:MerC domain-containing protein n=1 Tax=Ascaris lumbricoides TaxID=6252 RepID=A0A0M3IG03_ASCLU